MIHLPKKVNQTKARLGSPHRFRSNAKCFNVLYIATSDIHLKTFHVPYLEWLVQKGHTVDLAFEDRGGISFDMAHEIFRISFPRSLNPARLRRAYVELKRVIDEGDYHLLHCHTPIPSALTRLAARNWRRQGGKLLYTSHGFHFYKGGPLRNWLAFYPAELLLSHLTDCIVTINSEDLAYTKNLFWGASSQRIPGIGIQPRGFVPAFAEERLGLRQELGFDPDDFILLYIAEFIPRKNHRFIIKAARDLRAAIPELKVVFLGRGALMDDSEACAKTLDVQDMVLFKGFRDDVAKFACIADVGISASSHEGLGIALLEQMMCAVPIVATEDRGHREFMENGETGFLFQQNNRQEFVGHIMRLYQDASLRKAMGRKAHAKAQEFTLSGSLQEMVKIYERFL